MATKFSDFTAQAATATAFVVGYDGTTNTQYSQTQLTDFVLGGTLGQSNTLTLGGYQINLSQGASGNYIQMDGANANSSPVFIDGRRNGQTRAKFSLNSGSGRLELFHFGSTKYVDLNPGGLINYFLTDTAIGSTTASARLHVKGQGNTIQTNAFLVENSVGNDIFRISDNRSIALLGASTFYNGATIDIYGVSDASAILTVNSTTKGLLPPRMTNTQRDAIGSPATGLTLYSTTNNKLQFYNGSAWQDAAGGDNIYTADGTINEDRVITVGHDATTKASYTTTFESNKSTNNTTRNTALGNRLILTETVTSAPTSYSSSRGASISLNHNSTGDDVTGSINVQSINSGSSDYFGRSQMGFRTNTGFVFRQEGTAPSNWNGDALIVRDRAASNQSKSLRYHPSESNGGRLKLVAPNAKTSQIILATDTTNSFYRYISGDNNGALTLGRKLSGASEQAYITMSGVGSYVGNIAVGVNQGTPTSTLHVTGSGNTFATTSLLVENSDGSDLINVRDSGRIAIGLGASNSNDGNVVFGPNASASGGSTDNSVVIGKNTSITGSSNAVAVGGGTLASGSNSSIAIGPAYINGGEAIAIGNSSRSNLGAVSIGHDSGSENNTGSYNLCLGTRAKNTTNASNVIVLNATGSTTATSGTTDDTFSVFMTSNTSPDFKVIGNEGMIPPSITTTVRDAISSPVSGSTIYNTTDNKLQFYNGSDWTDAGGGGDNIYTADGTLSGNRTVTVPGGGSITFSYPSVGYFYVGSSTISSHGQFQAPINGRFQINSYSTVLKQNHLLLYATTYITGTTTGFVTVSGTTGTSHSINARLGVIGKSTTSTTDYAFRVQQSDNTDLFTLRDDGAFALGKGATSISSTSVAIGELADSGHVFTTNIGYDATTSGNYQTAIGASSLVSGNFGIAIGANLTRTTGNNSITLNSTSGTGATTNSSTETFAVYMSDKGTPDFTVVHDGNSYITGTGNFGVGITNPTDRIQTKTSIGVIGDGSNAGTLKLYCEAGTNHHVAIEGPAHLNASGDYTIKLPNTAPSAGQVLVSDANGNLSWKSPHELDFSNLPTSDPGVEGRLYNDEGTLKVSIP